MKRTILLIGVILLGYSAKSQQESMFTHYMFNTLAVNPAYAGSRDALTITALSRNQWVSFPGAPKTQTLTLHSPVSGDKVGLGLSVLNDKIGPNNNTSAYIDYAFKIKINERGHKLALGLKAGVNLVSNNLTSLKTSEAGDNAFANNTQSKLLPNFGFGIYYSAPKFYLGLSTPKLIQNEVSSSGGTNTLSEKRHYFFIAGTVISLNSDWYIKPTTLIKVVESAPMEAELTGSFYYRDKFWIGAGYRTAADAYALVGLSLTESLAIGYSFDWSFVNNTAKYNLGTHELMLRYDLVYQNQKKIKSPRYF